MFKYVVPQSNPGECGKRIQKTQAENEQGKALYKSRRGENIQLMLALLNKKSKPPLSA